MNMNINIIIVIIIIINIFLIQDAWGILEQKDQSELPSDLSQLLTWAEKSFTDKPQLPSGKGKFHSILLYFSHDSSMGE